MSRKIAGMVGGLGLCLVVVAAGMLHVGHRRSELLRLRAMEALHEARDVALSEPRALSVRVGVGGTATSLDLRCTLRVTDLSPDGVRLMVSVDAEPPQAYPPLPAGQGLTLVGTRDSCRIRVRGIHGDVAVLTVLSVPRLKAPSPVA